MIAKPINHEIGALPITNALTYKVYSDLIKIKEISPQWDSLLEASSCYSALLSAEWYIASCRAREPLIPFLVVAVRGVEPVGILSLVFDPEEAVATFPTYKNDYNDIIASQSDPVLAASLLNYAMSLQNGCNKIVLSRLKPDSNCVKAIPFITNPNIDCRYRETDTYYYVDLPGSFDDYLASRSRGFRKSIKRAQRNFEKSDLVIRELKPDTFDPAQLPELFISLTSARHKEKCGTIRNAPQAPLFLAEVLPRVFDKRTLRAFAILDGERIIALDLCFAGDRSLGSWNGGFLDEAEHLSPGTLLFAHGIMQAIDMKLEEYDFLRGNEAYKRSWANNSRVVGEVELIKKG